MFSLRAQAHGEALRKMFQYKTRTRGLGSNHNIRPGDEAPRELVFENISEDDRENPPQGSYFSHVIERKNKLEGLYKELLQAPAGTAQETEVIQRLIQAAVGG